MEYARVTSINLDYHWDIPLQYMYFTTEYIGGRNLFTFYPDNGDALPIGDFKAEIRLKNGITSSINQTLTAPNSKAADGYSWVYTEDCGAPPGSSTPTLKRPAITAHSVKGVDPLTIEFTIEDPNVYSGWVWLCDTAGAPIGYSAERFRDSASETVLPWVNGGSGQFNTDGTTNVVTLSNADITYVEGNDFADISKFIVIVSDGAQYLPDSRYDEVDYMAFSEKTSF